MGTIIGEQPGIDDQHLALESRQNHPGTWGMPDYDMVNIVETQQRIDMSQLRGRIILRQAAIPQRHIISFRQPWLFPQIARQFVAEHLNSVSRIFMDALRGDRYDQQAVREQLNKVFEFVNENRDAISNGVCMKIIRFIKDVDESIENTVGLEMHGTPISLRAYCLVFIYVFPIVFIPTLVNDLAASSPLVVYCLAMIHGFILISLYNVQDAMEDPFDQVGLDDIKLEEFHFEKPGKLFDTPQEQTAP